MKVPPKILKHRVQPILASTDTDSASIPAESDIEPNIDSETKPMPIANPLNKPLPESVPKPAWKPNANVVRKPQPAPVKLTPSPLKQETPEFTPAETPEGTPKPVAKPMPVAEPAPGTESAETETVPDSIETPDHSETQTTLKADATQAPAPTTAKNRPKKPLASRQSTIKGSPTKESALAQRIVRETSIQKTPDSLPVLEAFQEFLDSEQRRMRKRMIAISTFFTVAIILLLGGAAAAAFLLLKPMKTEVDGIRTAIATLEQSSSRSTESTSATIAKLNSMIETERQQLRESTTDIESKVTGYGDDLTAVRDHLATLQSENSELKEQLGTLKKDLPNVTYKVASLMNEIDKLRGERQPAPVTPKQVLRQPIESPEPESEPVVSETANSGFSAMISFVPKGKEKRVLCLLPIPE